MSDSQEQSDKPLESPGKLLRELREKQQLSVEDIAKRIHLETKIVTAIEADDYGEIPTATYARGYLRSYAKSLEADADYIVSLYNAENEAPPPEILPEVKPPSQVSSSDKPVKAFTYLITLALFLLILIWYQSNYIVGTETAVETETTETQSPSKTPSVINNTDTTFDVVVHPEGWQSPISVTEEAVITDIENEISDNSTQLSITEQMTSIETEDNETLSATEETVMESSRVVSAGSDTIIFQITQDSWLEVYDSSESRLFMNLAKQGETIDITGTAPFNLIIGYSPGVTIKFNDQAFDPEPFSNNGVARFSLPVE